MGDLILLSNGKKLGLELYQILAKLGTIGITYCKYEVIEEAPFCKIKVSFVLGHDTVEFVFVQYQKLREFMDFWAYIGIIIKCSNYSVDVNKSDKLSSAYKVSIAGGEVMTSTDVLGYVDLIREYLNKLILNKKNGIVDMSKETTVNYRNLKSINADLERMKKLVQRVRTAHDSGDVVNLGSFSSFGLSSSLFNDFGTYIVDINNIVAVMEEMYEKKNEDESMKKMQDIFAEIRNGFYEGSSVVFSNGLDDLSNYNIKQLYFILSFLDKFVTMLENMKMADSMVSQASTSVADFERYFEEELPKLKSHNSGNRLTAASNISSLDIPSFPPEDKSYVPLLDEYFLANPFTYSGYPAYYIFDSTSLKSDKSIN